MASTDARVCLEGAIPGFLASPCVFRLTAHRDGSLTGTVAPSSDHRDALVGTLSLFDGVAVPIAAVDSSSHTRLFKVKFQIAKLSDLPGVVFYVDVEGELSPVTGLQGHWNVAGSLGRGDPMDPDRPLHLAVCDELNTTKHHSDGNVAISESALRLHPLTQGFYKLLGATIADNGYLYRATWTLTLRANGVLEGTSLEDDNVPQLCRLEGSWTSTHIKLIMTYVVNSDVGTYVYEGDVRGAGLRGRCVNTKLPDATNERGNFEFNCVQAIRRWNVDDHSKYPRAFRDAVRACLLSSLRTTRLPGLLWREVFSFCGFEWFGCA